MDGAITHNSLTIVKFIGTVGILESVKALQSEENDGWHGGAFHSHFSSPGRTCFIFKPLTALCVHWSNQQIFLHAMQSQRSLRETQSMLKYVFMFVA